MSASASKKKRKLTNDEGLTLSEAAAQKELQEQRKKRRPTIVFCLVALLAVALIVALVFVAKHQADLRRAAEMAPTYDVTEAAVTVGDETVTVPMYNYFYQQTVNNNAQMYVYFYGLQMNVPFAEQSYGTGTFEDLFKEQTNTTIQQFMSVYAEAKAAGYELTEDDKAAIEDGIQAIKDNTKQYGLPSEDYYLYNVMGEGCNMENYREYLEVVQTASGYAASMEDTFEPTADEISAAYAEDPDAYDIVSYSLYTVNAEGTEVEDEAADENAEPTTHTEYTEEALAKAKADAKAAAASFPTEGATEGSGNKSTVSSRLSEDAAAWLFAAERQAGDVENFAADEEGHSYQVVRYEGRDTNDYNCINAYVISIGIDNSAAANVEGGNPDIADGRAVLERINAGMKDGMSDEDFEQLVRDNGYTPTSYTVNKTSYNDDVTDYLFDASRQAGDYSSFEDADTIYFVRYQSEAEETYQTTLVRQALHESKEEAWFNGVYDAHPITVNDEVLANAHTNLTLYSNEG